MVRGPETVWITCAPSQSDELELGVAAAESNRADAGAAPMDEAGTSTHAANGEAPAEAEEESANGSGDEAMASPGTPPGDPIAAPAADAGPFEPVKPLDDVDSGSQTPSGTVTLQPTSPNQSDSGVPAVLDVDVPPSIVQGGGTMEVRRVTRVDLDNPSVVTVSEALEPGRETTVVSTDGVELLAIVFRDAAGDMVDGQLHQPLCPQMRPERAGGVLNVPAEYASIQEAIDAALPGDTIFVAAGTYTESVKLAPNVALVGEGPEVTTLDGQGEATHLVDVTGAYGSMVTGFRFINVTADRGCSNPDDESACSGDWYGAALYGDGHAPEADEVAHCHPTTTFISGNHFEDNGYAVMLYFRSHAIVEGNSFDGNAHGLVANHGGDEVLFVENNMFTSSTDVALASSAAYVFASFNTFRDNLACRVEYIQRGAFECNMFTNSETCELVYPGEGGNVECAEDCEQAWGELLQSCVPEYLEQRTD